ncbi:MAG: hypothetical protein IJV58_04165, partial [Oscillospiraceae bacterium]|nr:hypothetical protein [Oscillospiraceae bacterium]
FQKIRANVPQVPVFKSVPLQCPNCAGQRVIDNDKKMIVCPFCESKEQLIVDCYKTDEEEIQKQIQEFTPKLKSSFRKKVDSMSEQVRRTNTKTGCLAVLLAIIFIPAAVRFIIHFSSL